MKKIAIVASFLAVQTSFGQDCATLAATKPSTTVRTPNVTTGPGAGAKPGIKIAAINPRLDAAERWIKGLLNNFTGAKLSYSNTYAFDASSDFSKFLYNAAGVKEYYYSQMRFYSYYCSGNNIMTEGESGSSVMVYFNNFFDSYGPHSLGDEAGLFTINGKPAKTKSNLSISAEG